jgi:hypothetical protein
MSGWRRRTWSTSWWRSSAERASGPPRTGRLASFRPGVGWRASDRGSLNPDRALSLAAGTTSGRYDHGTRPDLVLADKAYRHGPGVREVQCADSAARHRGGT